jgi:sulfur relay (sulfurtransferase) DsrC/TusE family protein
MMTNTPKALNLLLITDFTESAQYRSKQAFKQTNARVVCDHAFMDMIAIWIMYNEFNTAPIAREYAARTASYSRFTNFRQASTDLYLNLHVITERQSVLLGSDADATLLDRVQLDVRQIVRYLRMASSNRLTTPAVRQTLQRMEQALHIETSNYRSIRRLAQNWPALDTSQKRTVLTRMVQFYKMNARRSEMGNYIKALAKSKNLLDPNATDAEISPLKKAAAVGAAGVAGFATGYQIGKNLL